MKKRTDDDLDGNPVHGIVLAFNYLKKRKTSM